MKLKSNEIEGRLQNSPPPPAILLFGQEQGLIAKQVALLQSRIIKEESEADFDREIFFAGDLDQERFFSACQAFPFLSSHRFILLKEAHRIPQEARKNLLAYLKKPSATTLLVVQSGNLEASNPLRKGFETSKIAWAAPFYPLEGHALGGWIRQQLQEKGYQVDNDALSYLAQRLEGDTLAAANELEKLQLFLGDERRVGLEEVMAVVGETLQHSPFGLASATANGQKKEALKILDKLLESGEEPLALLGILTLRLRRIIQGQALLSQGENPKAVARKLRIFWREERAFFNQCHSTKPRTLANGLMDCLEADKALKGGGGTPKRVMGGLIMRLASRFAGRPGYGS
ncbi:MAG: DNA polymerase III subunit delta [Magnetococcales bacterium]|nr:DNA polymerase III subunit delta [Magnetococcales bacterium]